MKEQFEWYFPRTQAQIKDIWDRGILTVDTNVLLDLYRYHEDTTKALLDSLILFKGRAWISHQVAEEFFRNRNKVILSSIKAFNDAEQNIAEIRKASEEPLKKLKNNRIIPDEVADSLEQAINSAVKKTEGEIQQIRTNFPDYIKKDPILKKICELFDSSIGAPFEKDNLPEILKEAKRRAENNIPPGFKDKHKEGDKTYGDYMLWRQILDYIKDVKTPLILVTSEEKEDWWEKVSGRTVGPLYDLLKEFHDETKQPLLLYRTSRFLEFSNEKTGKEINSEALSEIIDVARARQKQRDTPLARVLNQNDTINDGEKVSGQLIVELLEPVYRFTCSGHFSPPLDEIPSLRAKLVKSPNGTPNHSIRYGTGTTFDFNIHLKSTDFEVYLPTGQYVFEYDAKVENSNDENTA
jgi:hypothetical protein